MADFLAKPLNGLSQETSRPNIRSFQAPQPGSPIQEPETIKVPRIRSLGQSFGRIDQANKALRMQLSVSQEPLSEAAKVESARLMAKKLGLSLGYVLDNYDQISENITGIANNPQGALEYIANQYRGGASFIKEARLWAELRKDPSSARRPFILEEIQNLRDDLPPLDTSEKSWLMGSIGSAANMIPYTWAVGKYMVPGAALSLVTRGAAGKSQLATGLAMAASLITTAGKAVSFAESLDLAGGIIFGDLMEMTDEQGNPIDEAVAQTISGWARLPYAAIETISAEFLITGSSPLAKLLKKIPSGALEKAYTRAAARTVNALGLKGSYRALANMMVRSGGAVVSQAATGVSGEVMEEVAQGNIQIVAEELAKQITNELTGSEFQSITGAEWRDEMTETVEQTVGAVLVLQTPWMIKGGIDAQRQYNKISQNNAALRKAEAESEITEFLKTASDEEADIILEQQLAEAEEEAFQDIEFKTGEDKVTATTRTGTQAGTISYTVTEDSVVIDNLTLPDPTKTEVAAQLVEQVRDQFPDLNIDFSELSETATTISRAVEDLDITLREFNTQIDQANFKIEQNEQQIEVNDAEIKILQADLAEAEDEKAIGSLQVQIAQKQEESQTARESIELSQTRVNRLEEAKNTQRQKLPEETRDFTPEEFQEKVEGPAEAKERFINTPAGEAFRQTLEDNLPNLSSEEIDAVIRLVELRANAVGVSAEVWIKENLIEGVFASAEKARELAEGLGEEVPDDFFEDALGVTLFDEGRALIVATGATDFTTMVHELGHIFRRDLSEAEQKTAYDWARKESKEKKDTGNWTVKMEEAFATSFENYIYTGKTEHAEMKSIFQKFAEFMQSIFQVVKDLELAPEIRGVFENLLTDERIEALKDGTAEAIEAEPLILFQKAPVTTKYRKAIRKAFKQGAFISDETLASLGETWADKELEKRVEEAQKLEDFSWLANIARESGTYAEFKEESELYMGPKVDQLKNEAWLKEFYEAATREQGVTDINTGNAQWVAGLTDEFITGMIQEISQDIDAAKKAGIPVAITSQAIRFAAKGSINEKQIQIIRKTLQNRPSTYRQSISILIGDIEEAQRVDQERAFSEEIGIEDVSDIKPPEKKTRLSIAKKIDDVVTKKQVERGEINTKDINSLFQDGKKLLLASDKEVKKLEEDLRQHDRALAERLRKITDYNERQAILQKDETRQKIKDAIKKERARKTELLKQQKERKRLKEYARKLGAYITKKVPGSVHIDYREIIQEIQSGIDPNFRQKRKMTEKEIDREFYDNHPELAAILPKGMLQDLHKKSLNEMSIEELEGIKDRIDGLIDMGKLQLAVQKQAEKIWVEAKTAAVADSIRKGEPAVERELIIDDPRTTGEKVFGALLKTYRPSRIADWLDGGKDFHGVTHELMITAVNKAYNNELTSKHKRQEAYRVEMDKLGLKNKDFERIVTIEGRQWTIDQIMDVYVGMQNELKSRAILFGNFSVNERNINLQDTLIAELTENEKKFADYLVRDYADNYERLREAYRKYTNLDLGQEENYTPIRRMRGFYNADEMDVAQELLDRKSFARASVQKQFTIARLTNIKEEHQQPIQLGLVSSWMGQVEKQEHYINSAEIISRMNKVMSSQEVKQAASQVHKTSGLLEMDSYIKRFANPSIYKAINGWDPLIKTLRNNSALAYLAYNTVTILKQLPSVVYYMSYSTPGDFIQGIFQMISHPFKTVALVESLDPQMKERSIERYIEEMKQKHHGKYKKIIDKVGLTGMKGIMWMDKVATTAGWIGVYNKNKRSGRSEEESIRMARQATLHTQPAASAKDVASLYAQDNFLTIFLQFTNQLNQLWNIATYDAPQAIRNRHYWQAAAMYGGMMAGAMAMWMISNRRLPEDDEDYRDIFTDQLFAIMPVGGRIIGAARDGWNLNIPIVTPLLATGHAISFAERALNGQDITDVQAERVIKELGEAFAISAGVPFTEPKRIYDGLKKGKPFQYIVFGGELNDK